MNFSREFYCFEKTPVFARFQRKETESGISYQFVRE